MSSSQNRAFQYLKLNLKLQLLQFTTSVHRIIQMTLSVYLCSKSCNFELRGAAGFSKKGSPIVVLHLRLGPFLLYVSQIEGILDQFDLFSLGSKENGNHIEPRLYVFEAFLL